MYGHKAAFAESCARRYLTGLADWQPAKAGMFMWLKLVGAHAASCTAIVLQLRFCHRSMNRSDEATYFEINLIRKSHDCCVSSSFVCKCCCCPLGCAPLLACSAVGYAPYHDPSLFCVCDKLSD